MVKIKSKFSEEELVKIQNKISEKSGLYNYMSKDYPFEVIVSKYGEEKDMDSTLYIPSYQREFVWDL